MPCSLISTSRSSTTRPSWRRCPARRVTRVRHCHLGLPARRRWQVDALVVLRSHHERAAKPKTSTRRQDEAASAKRGAAAV